jgi:ABC-2 type transport system permease protein
MITLDARMGLARTYAAAVAGIAKRDLAIFVSYRARFLTTALTGFFSLVLFYYISRLVAVRTLSPDEYFAFVVIGLVIMEVIGSTLSLVMNIRTELLAGTFERIILSPLGPVAGVFSMTLFPFVLSLAHAAVTVALAAAVFGMDIRWSTAPLALPIAMLGALAFAPFALLLAASVVTIKQAAVGAGFLVTGISLIGGFFFPVELLPDWVEWTSEVQPFTPALEALRYLLVGRPMEDPMWQAVLKIALFALVLLPVGLWTLRTSIRFAQRRGTIIEY